MEKEIDHSIDVRYEPDVIVAFNRFIKKWCGDYAGHLLDDDENDGQFMREKIAEMVEGELKGFIELLKLEDSEYEGGWTRTGYLNMLEDNLKQYLLERKDN